MNVSARKSSITVSDRTSPGVRRKFELAGLQETLELIDDPDAALVE